MLEAACPPPPPWPPPPHAAKTRSDRARRPAIVSSLKCAALFKRSPLRSPHRVASKVCSGSISNPYLQREIMHHAQPDHRASCPAFSFTFVNAGLNLRYTPNRLKRALREPTSLR